MLTYRAHVYKLAMAASAEATTLALSLSHCVREWSDPDYRKLVSNELPTLRAQAASLRQAIGVLMAALPGEVNDAFSHRHLNWIDFRLNKGEPIRCLQDPIDIAEHDLPGVLKRFDEWYEDQSPVSADLDARLLPLLAAGQLNSAGREAWVVLKRRLVEAFELPDSLDGHKLVEKVFGPNGASAGRLPERDRQAYCHLLKGLYTLNRNLIAHNDADLDPEGSDAVVALINQVLVKVDEFATVANDA